SNGKIQKAALVIDLRGREFFTALNESLQYLKENYTLNYEILFLDASDAVLVQRYKETRRRHPLAQDGLVLDGIHAERKMLEDLKGQATQVIDTSNLRLSELKQKIASQFTKIRE